MKKISVIIPMYNSEAFIRQCIQSVINQTYQDFEIIVVDDGSTDQGPQIIGEIREKDDRIHLYRREKQGVSAARNYGLDIAAGEYVFFLDSDDAIHPLLFEEMVYQMEGHQAEMSFCAYEKIDSGRMETILNEISCGDERPEWEVKEGEGTEKLFYKRDAGIMTGIGSKMIRMDLIGGLRFDETLINGEDTLFIYYLLCRQARSVFSYQKWYYYRIHPKSATHSIETVRGEKYFECIRRIRDSEYQKGRIGFAMKWEARMIDRLKKGYLELKRVKDINGINRVKRIAKMERKHPLYSRMPFTEKILFFSCFHCSLLFRAERRFINFFRTWKQR